MRIGSSPLPRFAAGPDRADASAGPPAGEPFRSALRDAGGTDQAAPPAPDNPADPADPANQSDPADPSNPADPRDHTDDTMAPAAAQVAYLARMSTGGGRARSQTSAPTQATHATGDATASDALDTAISAALALGANAAPVATTTAEGSGPSGATPSAHDSAGPDRKTTPPHLPEAGLDPITAATLRAAYGLHTGVAAPQQPAAPQPAASRSDSPVDAWTAAAIGRAISTLGSGGATRPAPGAAPVRVGQVDATAATGATGATAATAATATATATGDAASGSTADAVPDAAAASAASAASPTHTLAVMTPLEQAVHDLVGRFDAAIESPRGRATRSGRDAADATAALPGLGIPAPDPARDPAAPAASTASGPGASAATATPPEPPANPSHVHLVIDDGPERVVATVSVRGSEVHVALRATDDTTAAALARNAGTLDHAMQGRGLQLGELTAERDRERAPRDRPSPQDAPPRERRARDAEKFELEEKP